MRPLAGESIHQFIERSGNFIPSLLLLYIESHDVGKIASGEYTFQQWLVVGAMLTVVGMIVCGVLRLTKLMAADSDSTKKHS